ncbi:hypothetical protein THASP1DRAFT_26608, partial [Thamnocephalis sphaerospora]
MARQKTVDRLAESIQRENTKASGLLYLYGKYASTQCGSPLNVMKANENSGNHNALWTWKCNPAWKRDGSHMKKCNCALKSSTIINKLMCAASLSGQSENAIIEIGQEVLGGRNPKSRRREERGTGPDPANWNRFGVLAGRSEENANETAPPAARRQAPARPTSYTQGSLDSAWAGGSNANAGPDVMDMSSIGNMRGRQPDWEREFSAIGRNELTQHGRRDFHYPVSSRSNDHEMEEGERQGSDGGAPASETILQEMLMRIRSLEETLAESLQHVKALTRGPAPGAQSRPSCADMAVRPAAPTAGQPSRSLSRPNLLERITKPAQLPTNLPQLRSIYVTGLKRTNKNVVRNALKEEGVTTQYIADIWYTNAGPVEFLVKEDYADTFLDRLRGTGLRHLPNYDPRTGSTRGVETRNAKAAAVDELNEKAQKTLERFPPEAHKRLLDAWGAVREANGKLVFADRETERPAESAPPVEAAQPKKKKRKQKKKKQAATPGNVPTTEPAAEPAAQTDATTATSGETSTGGAPQQHEEGEEMDADPKSSGMEGATQPQVPAQQPRPTLVRRGSAPSSYDVAKYFNLRDRVIPGKNGKRAAPTPTSSFIQNSPDDQRPRMGDPSDGDRSNIGTLNVRGLAAAAEEVAATIIDAGRADVVVVTETKMRPDSAFPHRGRGGVAVMVHPRWRDRVFAVEVDPEGRFITFVAGDWVEGVRRVKRRAKAAAANLRRLGLHRRGLKWQQGVFLYKVFVRPCMEYGLALIPPTKTLLAELDLIQISVLREVTRSYASTSHGVLLRLAGCTDMRHRGRELAAGWLARIDHAPAQHAIAWLQYGARCRSDWRSSIFARLEHNNAVIRWHREDVVRRRNEAYWLRSHPREAYMRRMLG